MTFTQYTANAFYVFDLFKILSGSLQGDRRFFQEIAEIFEYEDRLPAINDNGKAVKVPRPWAGGHKEIYLG
jgi:hypothetical protein